MFHGGFIGDQRSSLQPFLQQWWAASLSLDQARPFLPPQQHLLSLPVNVPSMLPSPVLLRIE
jgi:hypothetical protein